MHLLTWLAYAACLRGVLTRGLRRKTDNSLRGAYAELTRPAYAASLRGQLTRPLTRYAPNPGGGSCAAQVYSALLLIGWNTTYINRNNKAKPT